MPRINLVARIGSSKDFIAEISYDKNIENETDCLNALLAKYPIAAGYKNHEIIPEPQLRDGRVDKNWLWWWKRFYRGTIVRNNADGTRSLVSTFSEP